MLDEIDIKILKHLQKDGRETASKIADKLTDYIDELLKLLEDKINVHKNDVAFLCESKKNVLRVNNLPS